MRRGASVRLTDTRTSVEGAEQLEAVGVELEFGGHQPETLMDADLIVLSPGVPPDQPVVTAARAEGIEIIGELELAWRWLRGRVIAVTGTKGKSTTTTLVGRMLSASGATVQLGGNIGVPLSSQVDASTPDTVHVVEASSFQLETTISFRPWIAVWLNVSADHFDRHPTFDAYANAKARIFVNQTRDDWAVVNADDALVMAKTATARATPVMFSTTDSPAAGVMLDGDWVVRRTATESIRLFEVSAVELHGRHMLSNALAAAAVASLAGVQPESMAHALRGVSRPRARHGARRRSWRRAICERLEGHQRRSCQTLDRDLRPRCRGDHRGPVQGRRPRSLARTAVGAGPRRDGDRRVGAAGHRSVVGCRSGARGALDA